MADVAPTPPLPPPWCADDHESAVFPRRMGLVSAAHARLGTDRTTTDGEAQRGREPATKALPQKGLYSQNPQPKSFQEGACVIPTRSWQHTRQEKTPISGVVCSAVSPGCP